jgi:hypothetical protein
LGRAWQAAGDGWAGWLWCRRRCWQHKVQLGASCPHKPRPLPHPPPVDTPRRPPPLHPRRRLKQAESKLSSAEWRGREAEGRLADCERRAKEAEGAAGEQVQQRKQWEGRAKAAEVRRRVPAGRLLGALGRWAPWAAGPLGTLASPGQRCAHSCAPGGSRCAARSRPACSLAFRPARGRALQARAVDAERRLADGEAALRALERRLRAADTELQEAAQRAREAERVGGWLALVCVLVALVAVMVPGFLAIPGDQSSPSTCCRGRPGARHALCSWAAAAALQPAGRPAG